MSGDTAAAAAATSTWDELAATVVGCTACAELAILPEAGHLLMLEHHDVVTDHLRSLVERALRAHPASSAG